jgi:hypothetical protein
MPTNNYIQVIDLRVFLSPVNRVSAARSQTMDHLLFLGTEKDAGDILGAFEKVRKLAASLGRINAETAKRNSPWGTK